MVAATDAQAMILSPRRFRRERNEGEVAASCPGGRLRRRDDDRGGDGDGGVDGGGDGWDDGGADGC
ncbi:MAG: hypothetical protein AAFR52_13240 [Pseudomonadota bacterium]